MTSLCDSGVDHLTDEHVHQKAEDDLFYCDRYTFAANLLLIIGG
jgi:hypothetical protein